MVGESYAGQGACKVTVLEIRGDRVRLGFEVDRSVPVHRFELWERIHAEGCQAMLAAGAEALPAG